MNPKMSGHDDSFAHGLMLCETGPDLVDMNQKHFSLSYSFGGTLCLPQICKKEAIEIVPECGIMLKDSEFRKSAREACYIYCRNFINDCFFHS
jgi:hypothetical protein